MLRLLINAPGAQYLRSESGVRLILIGIIVGLKMNGFEIMTLWLT